MSENSRMQVEEEFQTFRSFCKCVPELNMGTFSIEHGKESLDEPDFICKTMSGDRLLFELCELATPEIKTQDKSGEQQPESCVKPAEAAQFRRLFPATKFRLDRLQGDGKEDATAVVRWFLRPGADHVLSAGASGSTVPYWCIPKLGPRRGAIHIEPGAAGCTDFFRVYNCAFFGSAVEESIRKKVEKSIEKPYRLAASIVRPQLLLHYGPEDPFRAGFGWENIPGRLPLRQLWEPYFTDVWMFEECPPEVLSHHHEGEANGDGGESQDWQREAQVL